LRFIWRANCIFITTPSIHLCKDLLWNLKNTVLQGMLLFFLGSGALGIGVAIILRMHASGVKHMQRVIESTIKVYCFF
jgi:hypothetical protein